MKRLCLLLYSGGTSPDLLYPSLIKNQIEVVTLFMEPESESMKKIYQEWVNRFGDAIKVSTNKEMINAALSYHQKKPIDGVITFSDKLTVVAAKIAQALNLPYNSLQSVETTQNKYLQRVALQHANIPIPKFYLIKESRDLHRAATEVGFPGVLKPVFGAGSYFVQLVSNENELQKVYKDALKSYKNYFKVGEYNRPEFLFEELMVGINVHNDDRYGDYGSVESLVYHGDIYHLCIQDRLPLTPPFRETGFVIPSQLTESQQDELFSIAEQAIQALGLTYGFTHIEIKFTKEGPKVIEVNARPGGGFPYRLKLAAPSYDLIYEYGRLSLGEMPETKPKWEGSSGTFIIHGPNKPIIFHRLIGIDAVKDMKELDLFIPVAKSGDLIHPVYGMQSFIGFGLVKGRDPDHIVNTLHHILQTLHIDFTDP